MSFEIHQKGFWINERLEGHCFDDTLSNAIGLYLRKKKLFSVVDFGCGPGCYVKELKSKGFEIRGYDGNPFTQKISKVVLNDGTYCECLDLTNRIYLGKLFDCVLSLEVGEHIPDQYEDIFFDNITTNSQSIVILSWAVEGQSGDGHVNCRNNDHVISQMEKRGFVEDVFGKSFLRSKASLAWFKYSLMAFQKKSEIKKSFTTVVSSTKIEEPIDEFTSQLIEACYANNDLGLYKGKTGILMTLHKTFNSINKTDSLMIKEAIKYVQDEISENAGNTDDSYSDGIFGIGWAVSTLYEEGYITENETEVMNSFDDELYKLVMYQKTSRQDLESGTMGRINYYLKRINKNLKITNKYRYVCNYECLMLLVDDFTSENEKILNELKTDVRSFDILTNNNGKFYSRIFNMLSILVDKNIHPEITEKQQLQFLKIFVDYLDFIKDEHDLFYANKESYWNTLSILNCLLKLIEENKTLKHHVSLAQPLFQKILSDMTYPALNVKELAIRILFYQQNNYLDLKNCFDNVDKINFSLGLNGYSGFLYLISRLKEKKFSMINNAFLI